MKLTLKKLLSALIVILGSAAVFGASAQTYVRYVKPEDFKTHAVYADSVLTSIVLPRGVSKLASYPKFNAAAYELSQVLKDPDKQLLKVWVCGSASPDGLWGYNVKLSEERTNEAVAYLKEVMGIPDSLIHKESLNEDWDKLAELVEASDMPYKDQVVNIIRTKSWGPRKDALQKLDGGNVWKQLCDEFFPDLRCVRFAIYCKWDPSKPHLSAPEPVVRDTVVVTETVHKVDTMLVHKVDTMLVKETVEVKDTVFVRDTVVVVKEVVKVVEPEVVPVVVETAPEVVVPAGDVKEGRQIQWLNPNVMAIKTNLVSDAMAIPSLGLEVQIYKGLSLDVSGSYGFYNIFNKSQRNMSSWHVSPELRWWFGEHPLQKGSFIGLHANVCNYSLEWRDGVAYQNMPDRYGWSAGFTYGACACLDRKAHWGLEFVIGAGYGRYHQNIGTMGEDGAFTIDEEVGTQVKHHFGLTKLAVNLVYRFSLAGKKK